MSEINEFHIGNMLPQTPLEDTTIIRSLKDFDIEEEIIESDISNSHIPVYIVLMHTGTLMSNLIKKFTNAEFSHCAISFDLSLTEMYTFGRKFDSNPLLGGFKKDSVKSDFFKNRNAPYSLYMVLCTKNEVDRMKNRLNFYIKKN